MIRIFFKLITPIQKLMQLIAPPDPEMSAFHVNNIIKLAKSGDVLHSRESLHFTSFFIKGFWKHSAIIYNENNELFVIEAIGKGVIKTTLIEWLFKKDYVLLQTRKDYSDEQKHECAKWANDQRGKKYDYEFSKDDDRFYCSELVADSLDIKLDGILEPTELSERNELLKVYDSRISY